MIKRAKIVATLGPASRAPDRLRELILAGMNVARVNMSHGAQESHAETIQTVRAIASELDAPKGATPKHFKRSPHCLRTRPSYSGPARPLWPQNPHRPAERPQGGQFTGRPGINDINARRDWRLLGDLHRLHS